MCVQERLENIEMSSMQSCAVPALGLGGPAPQSALSAPCAVDYDQSMASEKVEPLPKTPKSPIKKAAVEKRPKERVAGRMKGRISTPERKPSRKEPIFFPRDDLKKKKGSCSLLWHLTHVLTLFHILLFLLFILPRFPFCTKLVLTYCNS